MIRLLLETPVGPLLGEYDEDALRALRFWRAGGATPEGTRMAPGPGDRLGARLRAEIAEYFEGGRRSFELPLAPGGTPFQRSVWSALERIPYGRTRSYGELAAELGRPRAARAVGQANGANPIPIIVPCHRVLASGGGIGGYLGVWGAGSGIETKRWLLRHEGGLDANGEW